MNYALALHTASPDLGLAIVSLPSDLPTNPPAQIWLHCRAQTWDLGRELSTQLHACLSEFLQPQTWQDLAFIAVAQGPGGFTGTRIGVVAARTLAQQLEIPLFAISTLAAVAWATERKNLIEQDLLNTPTHTSAQPPVPPIQAPVTSQATLKQPGMTRSIAVEMSAQRGEVYGGIYGIEPQIIQGRSRSVLKTERRDAVMPQAEWQAVLAQWQTSYQLVTATTGLGWTAASVLELAYLNWLQGDRPNWSDVLPFYGQSPV